ncbi:helix-turn-helix transcriptional regulator [Vagococcus hydrophili]|uniref:YafY family transcriptional regulator n=1 Tax=Vagococcus hydrophili TaxID=2714947 RepID=A0A6G8ATF3_9ENTE|nr:YafY family protein [Vagococcus hydrophili]QIL48276.1 YafY family transcriptional regulator [Vagococcus hydrophili]
MKKNERLIAELFFINQKKQFNLNDLATEFDISKRTALRDIEALEEIGAPITVDKGRYGGYQVLKNSSLPPVYFNQNEWYSLFLALQLFKHLNDNPFDQSYTDLKNKLLSIVPSTHNSSTHRLDQLVVFEQFQTPEPCFVLSDLFQVIVEQKVITFNYTRYTQETRISQPLQLILNYGEWYLLTWDMDKKDFRKFRCDSIENITLSNLPCLDESTGDLLEKYHQQTKSIPFKCLIKEDSVSLFKNRQYPQVKLLTEKNQTFLVGTFDKEELTFLMNYLLTFGNAITILSPDFLITEFSEFLNQIQRKYQ